MTAGRLAAGPVSWGVDFAGASNNPPWEAVLDGIAAAGYGGTELGPYGYLPLDEAVLRERGLRLAGGFVFEPLHRPGERARIVRLAGEVANAVAALGGSYVLLIDSVEAPREATAGRSERAPRLEPARRDALGETIAAAAEAVTARGVAPLLHPHAGTYVEFLDEIEPLRSLCGLCLDTGHLAYAGIDPAALAGPDVGCVHLKDLDLGALRDGFWSSVAAGAFPLLGEGCVDLAAVLGALEGYDGWLVVEQDRAADPVGGLAASRRHLEELARCA